MNFLTIVYSALLAAFATAELHYAFHPLGTEFDIGERITNGRNAAPHAFPYQIALQHRFTPLGTFTQHCGGSLISSLWFVTAAHCFTNYPSLTTFRASAGRHNLNVNEASQQNRAISRIVHHPSWRGGPGPHDISVVRVASAFTLNNFVATIALPARNSVQSGTAVITGWGSTSLTGTMVRPSVLQTVTVPLLDTQVCWNALNALVRNPPLNSRTLENVCTGPLDNSRISVCAGDSGGPLAQRVGGRWQLVGVVSWGISPCGAPRAPSVFVRTSHYTDWILRTVA